ncbi:MAG: response regulator [Tepidisphaerales bacterium]
MKRTGDKIIILVVDDDPDCRLLIREAIGECHGHPEVYEAGDGDAALEFVFQQGEYADAPRPSLIYLDIEMPGTSGQEVLAAIKSSPQHREIPVVMMTGLCDEKQMRIAAHHGANSYTLKPAKADQFFKTLRVSTAYWVSIHQHPCSHWMPEECRREPQVR